MRLLDSSGRRRLLSRLALLPTLGLAACSLLYNLDGVQCSETADCQALGGDFVGTVCEGSVCVTPDTDGMGGGDGGCTTNSECIDAPDNFGTPAVCRSGTCIPLVEGNDCPVVLGLGEDLENLRTPEPIIIGAYAPFDPAAPTLSPHVLNYELAIDEMNQGSSGGIPGGPGMSLRPFIAVVCQSIGDVDLELSAAHLIDELEVPAIISALYADDLKATFNTKGLPNEVFFLSPLDADSNLTNSPDDGLLWHMLPGGKDIAPGYLALVPLIEEWVHAERGLADGEPIRLALVSADDQFLEDIKAPVVSGLTYNGGKDVFENEDDLNYLQLQTDSTNSGDLPDVSAAKLALLDFKPHVVLSIGAFESVTLIEDLEQDWNQAELGPKPFYVVSPYAYGAPALTGAALGNAHQRLFGVQFAGAEDTRLYENLVNNLEDAYPSVEGLAGKENFYDAVYFVMYAIAAAGDPARLTGNHVAQGMARLINPTSNTPLWEMGTEDIPYAIGTLTSGNAKIGLVGPLGDPEFDVNGARVGLPSIYCVDGARMLIQDALRYDPDTMTISGTQTCVPNFPP